MAYTAMAVAAREVFRSVEVGSDGARFSLDPR